MALDAQIVQCNGTIHIYFWAASSSAYGVNVRCTYKEHIRSNFEVIIISDSTNGLGTPMNVPFSQMNCIIQLSILSYSPTLCVMTRFTCIYANTTRSIAAMYSIFTPNDWKNHFNQFNSSIQTAFLQVHCVCFSGDTECNDKNTYTFWWVCSHSTPFVCLVTHSEMWCDMKCKCVYHISSLFKKNINSQSHCESHCLTLFLFKLR